jgi:hypothetical protein
MMMMMMMITDNNKDSNTELPYSVYNEVSGSDDGE